MTLYNERFSSVLIEDADDQGELWFEVGADEETGRCLITTALGHYALTPAAAFRMAVALLAACAWLGVEKMQGFGSETAAASALLEHLPAPVSTLFAAAEVGAHYAAVLAHAASYILT